MKRNWLIILIVAIVIIGMVTAIFIYNKKTNDKNSNMESTINKISEKVTVNVQKSGKNYKNKQAKMYCKQIQMNLKHLQIVWLHYRNIIKNVNIL